MLPNVPTETKMPTRVANRLGENRRVNTLNEPIKADAIPTPIRILPTRAAANEFAKAKRKAPKAPINEKDVMMMRGPIRSSMGPIGIWRSAKE